MVLGSRVGGFGSAVPLDQIGYYCGLVGIRNPNLVLRLTHYLDALQAAGHAHYKKQAEQESQKREAMAEAKRMSGR